MATRTDLNQGYFKVFYVFEYVYNKDCFMYKYNKTSIHSLLGWRYLEEPETLDEPDCSDITDMSLVRRDRGGGQPPPADRIDSSLARREKGGGTPPPVDGAATTLFSLMSWQIPSYNRWNKLWIRFWDHTYGVAGPYCRLTITIYFHCMLPMHFYLNKKINACVAKAVFLRVTFASLTPCFKSTHPHQTVWTETVSNPISIRPNVPWDYFPPPLF